MKTGEIIIVCDKCGERIISRPGHSALRVVVYVFADEDHCYAASKSLDLCRPCARELTLLDGSDVFLEEIVGIHERGADCLARLRGLLGRIPLRRSTR